MNFPRSTSLERVCDNQSEGDSPERRAIFMFKNLFKKKEEPPRSHVVIRHRPPMADDELRMAFGMVNENHPVWRAVHQLLQDEIDNAVSQVSSPEAAVNPGAMAHTAGGVEWLRHFQLSLVNAQVQCARVKENDQKKGG